MNTVAIMGRCVRDPETRYTPSGTAVCNLDVAVDGYKKGETNYFAVVFWGKTAETVNKYFSKGKPIAVQGALKQERWQDRETGANRSKVVINASSFSFVPRDNSDEGEPTQENAPAPASASTGGEDMDSDDFGGEEVPF
jgi:single-strand DNA-binding protein